MKRRMTSSLRVLRCCLHDRARACGDRWAYLKSDVKPATEYTARTTRRCMTSWILSDNQEYEFAVRGLIDAPETLES